MESKSSQVRNEGRRSFLRKAAYVAPVVVALGALTSPVSAHASIVFNQATTYNKTGNKAFVAENYDNVGKFTVNGTFQPEGGKLTSYDRNAIATAPRNYLQRFFDFVFRRS